MCKHDCNHNITEAREINTRAETNITVVHQTRLLRVAEGVATDLVSLYNGDINRAKRIFDRLYDPENTARSLPNRIAGDISNVFVDHTAEADNKLLGFLRRQVSVENALLQELYHLPTTFKESAIDDLETRAKALGIYQPLPTDMVDRIVKKPWPKTSKNFEARFQDVRPLQEQKILRSIRSSIAQGKSSTAAWRDVIDHVNIPRAKAELISKSEIQRVSSDISGQIFSRNQDVLLGVEFVSTLEGNTCMICGGLDGTKYYFEDGSYGDRPFIPVHPRCRCVYSPISRLWSDLGVTPPLTMRASFTGERGKGGFGMPVSGNLTFGSWLKKQSKAIQLDVLGPTRWALWINGQALKSFTSKGRILTLDEIGDVRWKPAPSAPQTRVKFDEGDNPLTPEEFENN